MAVTTIPPATPPADCSKETNSQKKADCEEAGRKRGQNASQPEEQADKLVSQVIYLPGDEYAITNSGGGMGTFKGSFQLTNGWMLTGMNQESDAKMAETIEAVAKLASQFTPFGGITPASAEESAKVVTTVKPQTKTPIFLLFEIDTANRSLHKVDKTNCLMAALIEQQKGITTAPDAFVDKACEDKKPSP